MKYETFLRKNILFQVRNVIYFKSFLKSAIVIIHLIVQNTIELNFKFLVS